MLLPARRFDSTTKNQLDRSGVTAHINRQKLFRRAIPRKIRPQSPDMAYIITYLLLEIPPIFIINENQVEIVSNRELFIDVTHCRCQVIPIEEQADWNGLTCKQRRQSKHYSGHTVLWFEKAKFSKYSLIRMCWSWRIQTTHCSIDSLMNKIKLLTSNIYRQYQHMICTSFQNCYSSSVMKLASL